MTRVVVVVAQIDSSKHSDRRDSLRESSTLQSFRYLEGMLCDLHARALKQWKVDEYRHSGSASIQTVAKDAKKGNRCCM